MAIKEYTFIIVIQHAFLILFHAFNIQISQIPIGNSCNTATCSFREQPIYNNVSIDNYNN